MVKNTVWKIIAWFKNKGQGWRNGVKSPLRYDIIASAGILIGFPVLLGVFMPTPVAGILLGCVMLPILMRLPEHAAVFAGVSEENTPLTREMKQLC